MRTYLRKYRILRGMRDANLLWKNSMAPSLKSLPTVSRVSSRTAMLALVYLTSPQEQRDKIYNI